MHALVSARSFRQFSSVRLRNPLQQCLAGYASSADKLGAVLSQVAGQTGQGALEAEDPDGVDPAGGRAAAAAEVAAEGAAAAGRRLTHISCHQSACFVYGQAVTCTPDAAHHAGSTACMLAPCACSGRSS